MSDVTTVEYVAPDGKVYLGVRWFSFRGLIPQMHGCAAVDAAIAIAKKDAKP